MKHILLLIIISIFSLYGYGQIIMGSIKIVESSTKPAKYKKGYNLEIYKSDKKIWINHSVIDSILVKESSRKLLVKLIKNISEIGLEGYKYNDSSNYYSSKLDSIRMSNTNFTRRSLVLNIEKNKKYEVLINEILNNGLSFKSSRCGSNNFKIFFDIKGNKNTVFIETPNKMYQPLLADLLTKTFALLDRNKKI